MSESWRSGDSSPEPRRTSAGSAWIRRYVPTSLTKEHGLALSQRRVEALRRRYGSLAPAEPRSLVVVEGRDAKSGRPSSAEVTVGGLAAGLDRAVGPLMALA